MFMEPELQLAKKILCVQGDHFKNLLDERSSYGLLKDFDPLTWAMQIKTNLDQHHSDNNESSNGLIFS